MKKVLVACTGSVATIKLPILIDFIQKSCGPIQVQVVVTKAAQHFYSPADIDKDVKVFTDEDEWSLWEGRGDPVLHIDLAKWADILLVAPLDANTMAKIANGLCDNLLTCILRAWDLKKPVVVCPAMNTMMWMHPVTKTHIEQLEEWGYQIIPPISKTLMCGDTGVGAMAEVTTIVDKIKVLLLL